MIHATYLPRRTLLAAAAAPLLTGCSAVQVLDALVPRDNYRADIGLAYGALSRQRIDVYQPSRSAAAASPRPPLVVFFYGGNWTTGQRADYRFVGEALAGAGAVVAIPDYRLSPGVRYPTFLEDCAQAVRWAVNHADRYGADPDRLVLMGHSAGAYNAAMLALDPRWLQAVGLSPRRVSAWIGLAGPYDFLPIDEPMTRAAFEWPATPADSQPIAHVTPQSPPALLLAADRDDTVDPDRNSAGLAERLRAAGVEVSFKRYPRVNHVTLVGSLGTPLRWMAPVRRDVLRFLGLVAS
ncbi:alpha/beta hydrolase [Xylophilus sp. GOD-11R]|uniref:alpha/beta hydrolase n=1 Tax=Xylophilus sp. GOD-11R TaxID=3089814 RepID=UPI00298C3DB9|nr:alpha/beta hydrolase [Xylophilus sp. GOD-11R]WPB58906.1 alpha/beta hydrolase [Xylophilus sp. GOD-11R]